MKPKLYSYLTVALFAAIFVLSCKKGDPGPAGPAGPAGSAGAAGTPGTPGAAGPAGTSANVTYSAWLDVTLTPQDIIPATPPNTVADTLWGADIPAVKVTADMINKGSIQLYFNINNAADPDIVSVPYTDLWLGINLSSDYKAGHIFVYSVNANLTTQGTGNAKIFQWRYVLIPGTTTATAPPGLKYSDYKAVKRYYNIPD